VDAWRCQRFRAYSGSWCAARVIGAEPAMTTVSRGRCNPCGRAARPVTCSAVRADPSQFPRFTRVAPGTLGPL